MFKNILLTSFLFFIFFVTFYPSKKENTNLIEFCYSFEKILARNSLDKNKNFFRKYNPLVYQLISFGSNKTKGALVNKIIDQYKTSKKLYFIKFVPNKLYCLAGYWVEVVNPGTFQSIIYEKSKQNINQYNNSKKEVDAFIKDINLEFKSIKKEIDKFF